MGIEINGLEEWQAEVRKIVAQYPEKGAEFLDYQGKKLARMVKSKTPVGTTGKLKKSWRRTKPKEKRGSLQAEVKSSAPYAHLVEYGHVIKNQKGGPDLGFVPGQHMLQNGFDQLQSEWEGELKKWFDELVKEIEV